MENLTIGKIERVCELKGHYIQITEINMEEGDGIIFELPSSLNDVKDWVKVNGYEGVDFRYVKQWYESEKGNGWYEDVLELMDEELAKNIELYSLELRSEWEEIGVIQ